MLKVSSVCSVGSFSLWLLCPHFGSKSLCHILSVIILPRFTQEWTIHPRLCSCHPSRALTNGSWPLLKPSPYPAWSLTGHLYIILFQGFASMWSSLDFLRARWLRVVLSGFGFFSCCADFNIWDCPLLRNQHRLRDFINAKIQLISKHIFLKHNTIRTWYLPVPVSPPQSHTLWTNIVRSILSG